jgi:hypothetical protein
LLLVIERFGAYINGNQTTSELVDARWRET